MRIDRCVCTDTTLADIVAMARNEGLSLTQLEDRFGCGTGCGLCRPYVRRALRTGVTVFNQIVHEADEPPAA
jgi:bacterioferritin-associated ferredoxin